MRQQAIRPGRHGPRSRGAQRFQRARRYAVECLGEDLGRLRAERYRDREDSRQRVETEDAHQQQRPDELVDGPHGNQNPAQCQAQQPHSSRRPARPNDIAEHQATEDPDDECARGAERSERQRDDRRVGDNSEEIRCETRMEGRCQQVTDESHSAVVDDVAILGRAQPRPTERYGDECYPGDPPCDDRAERRARLCGTRFRPRVDLYWGRGGHVSAYSSSSAASSSRVVGRSKITLPFCNPIARVQYSRASCRLVQADHGRFSRLGRGGRCRRRRSAQQAEHSGGARGIQARDRLVRDDEFRILGEHPCDGHPLPLPTRKPFGPFVNRPGQSDSIEGIHGSGVGSRPGEREQRPRRSPLRKPSGIDVVQHPDLVHQVEPLRDRADATLHRPELGGAQTGEVRSEDFDDAGRGRQGAVDQRQQRGLARSARAENGHPLPGRNREVDFGDRSGGAENPGDAGQSNDQVAHSNSPCSLATASIWS